jgi:hypothetical protein
MRPRFVPYASAPLRAGLQATADVAVLAWILICLVIGQVVYRAVAALGEVGDRVRDGADGIAGGLNSAGSGAGRIPLVGDRVSGPLRSAGSAARDLAGAGQGLSDRAGWLALVLAFAVAAPPAIAVTVPWLWRRVRFARRAGAATALARTPGGQHLLALRALSNCPLPAVLALGPDPVEGWRRGDRDLIERLAALELKAAGVSGP